MKRALLLLLLLPTVVSAPAANAGIRSVLHRMFHRSQPADAPLSPVQTEASAPSLGDAAGVPPIGDTSGIGAPAAPAPVPDVPEVPELKIVDPLGKILTSPRVVDHLTRGLAIAAPDDKILRQCYQFGLDEGRELAASPIVVPIPALFAVDKSCLACVIAAKRKDAEDILSGNALARIADLRARYRDIIKRGTLACAPLIVDEKIEALNAGAGLLALFKKLAGG